jgi:hypothetical protein
MELVLERQRTHEVDEYLKRYDDAATWLAETLDGNMRSEFVLRYDGQELYGRDGRPMGPIFESALEDAATMTLKNPGLAFELRRRRIELDEYEEMIGMADGERPNTMVVVSDFPPELMDSSEDVGGYNVSRKTTFLRVITRDEDGNIRLQTQTLDRSDRAGLESIYHRFGVKPAEGELLGQRIQAELTPFEHSFLLQELTDLYDKALSSRGGAWRAGRPITEDINTYDFVRTQHELVDYFVRAQIEDPVEAEKLRYDVAALLEKRFRLRTYPAEMTDVTGPVVAGYPPIAQEARMAGMEARDAGKNFSGCGLTTKSKQQNGPESPGLESLEDAGYGNKADEEDEGGGGEVPEFVRCANKKCRQLVPSKEVVKKDSWCCPKCSYEVDICSGRVICEGKG